MKKHWITLGALSAALGLVAPPAHADFPFNLPQPPHPGGQNTPRVQGPSMPQPSMPHPSMPSMPQPSMPHPSMPSMPQPSMPHPSMPSMPQPSMPTPHFGVPGPQISAPRVLPSLPAPPRPSMPAPPTARVVVPAPSVTVQAGPSYSPGPRYVGPRPGYVQPGPVYVQPGPAYVQPGPGYYDEPWVGPPPSYAYRVGEDPQQFAERMERMIHFRMWRIRERVQNGELPNGVLDEARQDRENIESRLQQIVGDGFVSRREAREITFMVRNIGSMD